MFTLLLLSLSAPPAFQVENRVPPAFVVTPLCSCNGKLPCSCGESCRCVAAEPAQPIQYARVCENGVCRLVPVQTPSVTPVTNPGPCGIAVPQPMPGPGNVSRGFTVARQSQRTWGLVGRPFLPWRR